MAKFRRPQNLFNVSIVRIEQIVRLQSKAKSFFTKPQFQTDHDFMNLLLPGFADLAGEVRATPLNTLVLYFLKDDVFECLHILSKFRFFNLTFA